MLFERVDFSALELPPAARDLREQVRAFLQAELAAGAFTPHLGHTEFDAAFTRKVAARGWIGMTWPRRYGGEERSYLERFVVTEELLAAAAPCAAHWFGDRQTGPSLLRYGSEELKQHFLPAIARGECFFALGMSEPGSGSDLASVRTRAERAAGGWRVTGQKVWTSWAHRADAFFVLCRTAPDTGNRHEDLSQLIVELAAPGVTVRPIRFMNGHHHFNEVFLDNVFVPDERVVGEIGQGWRQVTSELALERSGPERYMTTFPLLVELIRRLGAAPEARAREMVGRLTARLWSLRRMSLAIALTLDPGPGAQQDVARAGPDLGTEAALVKDMGTFYEREIIDAARLLVAVEPTPDATDTFERYLAETIVCSPVSTIRGGTTEVLRTLIARRLLGRM
ncbi:MAG: acyl-CoA dehydrogenase family protein [Betaproteobacteria bacterium]|nr:acyl-CoA dehydrogenase family protein [Betaproteobacteria bacterium]MDH3435457.1 acyl-CoA dehydrogenase family protein [Betaproteobacteria bacterium]